MKSVIVSGPGSTEVVEVPTPSTGPKDVLVRMRACGRGGRPCGDQPIAPGSGMIGSSGPQGALSEYLLVENAVVGHSLAIVPDRTNAIAATEGFASLRAPVMRVGAGRTPAPYAPNLEQMWLPDRQDIERAIEKLVGG